MNAVVLMRMAKTFAIESESFIPSGRETTNRYAIASIVIAAATCEAMMNELEGMYQWLGGDDGDGSAMSEDENRLGALLTSIEGERGSTVLKFQALRHFTRLLPDSVLATTGEKMSTLMRLRNWIVHMKVQDMDRPGPKFFGSLPVKPLAKGALVNPLERIATPAVARWAVEVAIGLGTAIDICVKNAAMRTGISLMTHEVAMALHSHDQARKRRASKTKK